MATRHAPAKLRPLSAEAHVLPLAVADQHHPLGQVAPGLDGAAHDLLEGFQRVLHLRGAGSLAGFHHQNVDLVCHVTSSVSFIFQQHPAPDRG